MSKKWGPLLWESLSDDEQSLLGFLVAVIAVLVSLLISRKYTKLEITQKTSGGIANAHSGSGDIVVGDKITREYDEEKLRNLVKSLAQDYRQQDAETIKELKKTIEKLKRLDETKYNKQEALDLLNQGQTEEAEKIFELIALEAKQKRSALDEEKQYWTQEEADAQRSIGSLAFLHNTQKALDAYQRSTELDPNNKSGWNQLGGLYQRIGALSKAENAYETVLKLLKDDLEGQAVAYGNLGLVYRTRGELDKAIEFHEKALGLFAEIGATRQMKRIQSWLESVNQ